VKVLAVLVQVISGLPHLRERVEPPQITAPVGVNTASRFGTWFGIFLTVFVLGGFAYGFAHSRELGLDLVITWTAITAIGGALGAIAAGAHPLSIAAGAIASPITPLHPALASGMLSGLVEAWVRKPRVADFAALRDDLLKWQGWWRNRVARVFVTFMLTNLGTGIAVWIAISKMGGIVAKH
jgi:pheromone shutdown protein TraB